MAAAGLKHRTRERIADLQPVLIRLAESIHARPEAAFDETFAAAAVSALAEEHGFRVTRDGTAFHARFGSGDCHVGFCAEYDALPELGHACGHNLIAAMSAGAAIALGVVADDAGLTVHLFGTPGEEALEHGGKIRLLEAGAFKGLHALLMAHPGPADIATPHLGAGGTWTYRFRCEGGHAFGGRAARADDALLIAELAVALLSRQLPPRHFVRGTRVPPSAAANVLPETVGNRYVVRAPTVRKLIELSDRLRDCFAAAALATGAELEVAGGNPLTAEMHHHPSLAALYRANAESLGRVFDDRQYDTGIATDLGNVSLVVPSIHPYIAIAAGGAANHDPAFAAACVGESAAKCIRDGATALAWTAVDWAEQR